MCAQGGIHSRNGPSVLLCAEGISLDLEITILLFNYRELWNGLRAISAEDSYWKWSSCEVVKESWERDGVFSRGKTCLYSCILYCNRKQKAVYPRLLKFWSHPTLISFLFSFLKVVLQLKWWNSDHRQYLLAMASQLTYGVGEEEMFSAKPKVVDAVKYWSEKAIMTCDQINY